MALPEFLTSTTAGLPNWAWGAVIVGGVGLGILLPKYLNRNQASSPDQASSNAGSGNAALDPNIDPFTGVPYSIESAINPSTGLPAYYGGSGVTQNAAQTPQDTSAILKALQDIQSSIASQRNPTPGAGTGVVTPAPGGTQNPIPQTMPAKFVFPVDWPNPGSTIESIARQNGTTVQALESFPENQYIPQRSSWDLIYTTDKIRVA